MPGDRDNGRVDRIFTVAEADALLPDVAVRMERLRDLQAEAAAGVARARRRARRNGRGGGVPAPLTREIRDVLAWFEDGGIQVKGISPPLVDFPALSGGREGLLCWTEGEDRIAFFHSPEEGFAGRRPIGELE
jgi:hypothetical protein